jgi:Family of unknown function (DUF6113)
VSIGSETVEQRLPVVLQGIGLLVFTLLGLLTGIYEVMFVPFRVSATIVPIAPLLAAISNAVLPWLSRRLTGDLLGAIAPVLGWGVAVIALAVGRPEGDVFLAGGSGANAEVGYAFMAVGFVTAVVAVMRTASRAESQARADRRAESAAPRR